MLPRPSLANMDSQAAIGTVKSVAIAGGFSVGNDLAVGFVGNRKIVTIDGILAKFRCRNGAGTGGGREIN